MEKYRGKYPDYKKGHFNKKYQFNRNKFKSIDTEEDAYWLGFFYADGFVKDKKGTFGFHLSIRDLEHLIEFRNYMKSNHPIYVDEKFCRLEICDKDYLSILLYAGLKQGKSHNLCMPNIAYELKRHFIRGVFDGDGWVGIIKKRQSIFFGIIGTHALISEIQIILIEECNLTWTKLIEDKRQKQKTVCQIVYYGDNHCIKIFSFLYENSTVSLERKRMIWENHFQNCLIMN